VLEGQWPTGPESLRQKQMVSLKEMLYDKRCPPNRRFAVDKITELLDMNPAPLAKREPESDAPILIVNFDERSYVKPEEKPANAAHAITVKPGPGAEHQ